jgi:hypothetical protein
MLGHHKRSAGSYKTHSILINKNKKKMNAFEKEKLIVESDNKQIRLTSHRLRYYETPKKNADFTSIMLDKISSIELTYYKSSIWLLIIGIVTIPIVVGLILIYMFFTSKRHVISVTPDGGRPIIFETKGMKRDFLDDFLDKVEETSMKLKNL